MRNTATIKDDHLYIDYEVYDYGYKMKQKIIPIENIECIKAKVGPKGGMHTWSLRGYNPEYSKLDYFKDNPRDVQIYSGCRKDAELIDQITKLLPNCKYHEVTEDGGAPW